MRHIREGTWRQRHSIAAAPQKVCCCRPHGVLSAGKQLRWHAALCCGALCSAALNPPPGGKIPPPLPPASRTCATLRATDASSAMPCSAAATVLAVGAFTTRQPHCSGGQGERAGRGELARRCWQGQHWCPPTVTNSMACQSAWHA